MNIHYSNYNNNDNNDNSNYNDNKNDNDRNKNDDDDDDDDIFLVFILLVSCLFPCKWSYLSIFSMGVTHMYLTSNFEYIWWKILDMCQDSSLIDGRYILSRDAQHQIETVST